MAKGTKHTRTQLAETLKENGAALLQVAIDKALAGDSSTLALCLSRLVPVLRPKTERVQFALDRTLPLADQAQQVVAAIAAGELDPDTGKLIIDCITAAAGLKSIDEFEVELTTSRGRLRAEVFSPFEVRGRRVVHRRRGACHAGADGGQPVFTALRW